MNLAEIETFLTIVNTKSITKTAETLFLSQPTVSHRLTTLEDELGFPLVLRKKGRKQVEITARGLGFIPLAERWVSLWKETQAIRDSRERVQLTVGCTDSVNNCLFYPFYISLLAGDSPLDVNIRTHQSWELYDLLNAHEIDVGFVYHKLHYKNVVSEMLFKERLYLVQGGEPVIDKPLVHTDELDSSMELFLNWDNNYRAWHDRWFAEKEPPRFLTDTVTLLRRVWTRREQWIIAPESVIVELSRVRAIFVSELRNPPPDRVCYRIRHRSPKLGNRDAVGLFNGLLDGFVKEMHREIPVGVVWGGAAGGAAIL